MIEPIQSLAGRIGGYWGVENEVHHVRDVTQGENASRIRTTRLIQLWVVVLESKKTALSVWAALPQTLAYLMANPQLAQPSFGLVTNGDEILFVKLAQHENRYYALSRVFSPFTSKQELYSVLQILKHIAQEIVAAVG